jgi:hypothetical protein
MTKGVCESCNKPTDSEIDWYFKKENRHFCNNCWNLAVDLKVGGFKKIGL